MNLEGLEKIDKAISIEPDTGQNRVGDITSSDPEGDDNLPFVDIATDSPGDLLNRLSEHGLVDRSSDPNFRYNLTGSHPRLRLLEAIKRESGYLLMFVDRNSAMGKSIDI